MPVSFMAILGLSFSVIAAAMAFLITYHEYRQYFINKKTALKNALRDSAVSFAIFCIIAIAIGLVLINLNIIIQ